MGDMADYYIELGLEQGWSPVGSYRGRSRAYGPPVSCNQCGSVTVFWQSMPGGKFELRNAEDHQKHTCPTSADGFGDCG